MCLFHFFCVFEFPFGVLRGASETWDSRLVPLGLEADEDLELCNDAVEFRVIAMEVGEVLHSEVEPVASSLREDNGLPMLKSHLSMLYNTIARALPLQPERRLGEKESKCSSRRTTC